MVKTPEMFEKYLPFAMAFGVERKWARAFQDIYRQPPSWYVGSNPSGFDFNRFSHSMSISLAGPGAPWGRHRRRGSSGSGFGGGGSLRRRRRRWWRWGLVTFPNRSPNANPADFSLRSK